MWFSKKTVPTIDVSGDLKTFRTEMIKSNFELCNYAEFNSLDNKDKIPLYNFIADNFNYLHKDILKRALELFPQYKEEVLSYILLMESSRMTNYCHMQKCLDLQKRRMADFTRYEIADPTFEKDYFYIRNNRIYYNWLRLVRIEDMIKVTNIYRKGNGGYCCYIYGQLVGKIDNYQTIKKILLYEDGEFVEAPVQAFREYCYENNLICPL